MAFDLGLAADLLGTGGGSPLEDLGTSFGVPTCMLEIAGSFAAQLLPSTFLGALSAAIEQGKQAALDLIAAVKAAVYRLLGIREDFNKLLVSIFGPSNLNEVLGTVAGVIGGLAGIGAAITQNYQAIEGELAAIKECLNQLSAYQKLQNSASIQANRDANYAASVLATAQAQISDALDFIKKADDALANIDKILYERSIDPELEPIYLDPSLSAYGAIAPTQPEEPVFRLVFGPPKSKKGQFLLSIDGLYYDSQSGGVPRVTGVVLPEEEYKFNFPSNIGGKGSIVSLKDLNSYIDTVFDLDKIDESPAIQEHYKADHFLQVLQGQRDKHIYDVSAQIGELISLGNDEDSAIVINTIESLTSVAAQHESKINRRKKQIEVAIRSPYILGANPAFGLGKVPINDFTYLKDLNLPVAFEKQKNLVFEQGEVSGVVLPVTAKFVKAQEAQNTPFLQHLVVPIVGKGSIIYDNDGTQTQGTVMSLSDSVVTENLTAIYNFLQGESTTPGSSEYKILNCASDGNNVNNAQLVGLNPSSIFTRGLGIPYLTGITKLTAAGNISTYGNYVRLPNTTTFHNLAYRKSGFTVEAWLHLPYAGSATTSVNSTTGYSVSSYHRLLLACENTGGPSSLQDPYKAPFDNSIDTVRGMMIGFTRDRQITKNLIPSNNTSDNPAADSVFYIAPTRSVNTSNVGFINKASVDGCTSDYEVLKLALPLSSTIPGTSKRVFNVSSEFMHFAISVDPVKDDIAMFVDGVQMISASLSQTFNLPIGSNFNVPSFAKSNSFSYSLSSTGSPSFSSGPSVSNGSFTPWIVGGGFTDGIKFMGQGHGINSGLNGYVGSLKFYSKGLTNTEIRSNFDSQKGFFKNIDLT